MPNRLVLTIVVTLGLRLVGSPLALAAPAVPELTPVVCYICDEIARPAAKPTADVVNLPVVRAVMFWMATCPHCHKVLNDVLPPLRAQHGSQLDILLIEVTTQEVWDRLVQIEATFGITRPGVPFLLIGDRALIGSDQIAQQLPGLVEQYLAAGGVAYPDSATLAPLLPTPAPDTAVCAPVTDCAEEEPAEDEDLDVAMPAIGLAETVSDALAVDVTPRSNGFALAVVILVGMVTALGVTGVTLWRGTPWRLPPFWQAAVFPALALAGLGVALYLSYVETQAVAAVCGPVGDCNAVQSSPYARLFGVLPIGVLGAIGYLLILAVWGWSRRRGGLLARYAPLLMLAATLFGVLFSIYLTYLEPFVIGAVCLWCLSSAVIMTLLMLLSVPPAVQALKEPSYG